MTNYRSTSETGHAKNVANFEELIITCQSFDTDYNPSNNRLTISELQSLLIDAQKAIEKVHDAKHNFILATNQRQIEFQDVETLATKIYNALAASGAEERVVEDFKTINRKIQGSPSRPKTNDDEVGQETKRQVSNSQKSYDKVIDHFSAMTDLLSKIPEYAPNEANLTMVALNAKLQQLKATNTAHIQAYANYSKMITNRNLILYAPITGILSVAKLVKKYVKSVFGATSTQYQQISDIEILKITH